MERPKGPVILKSRRSIYEPHFGQRLDSADELTCWVAWQLKQRISRTVSREMSFPNFSKIVGGLRLETSLASSFSMENG